jgi:hypothetical protein
LIQLKFIIAASSGPSKNEIREVIMLRHYGHVGTLVLSFSVALAFCGAPNASAQKLTYEQAFAKCKEDVTKNVNAGESAGTAARYARAGSCMHKYGFRLKKADRQNL